jgi:hypothetical protein
MGRRNHANSNYNNIQSATNFHALNDQHSFALIVGHVATVQLLPCAVIAICIVLALGQVRDKVAGIEGAQLAAISERNGIVEGAIPAVISHWTSSACRSA